FVDVAPDVEHRLELIDRAHTLHQRGHRLADPLLLLVPEDGERERFLRREVEVERALGEPGLANDVVERYPPVAVLGERARRAVEDVTTGRPSPVGDGAGA